MKPLVYALALSVLATVAACSSDDDDDERGASGAAGSTQGAAGAVQGGGGGGAGGAGGAGGSGGSAGAITPGSTCGTPEAELAAAPAAVKAIVDERQGNPTEAGAGDVVRYDYAGAVVNNMPSVVYYVPPSAAMSDPTSEVYSQAGELLCAPEGGLTGMGDGKCPGFVGAATNPCIVWDNSGKPK